jgi:DNA-directed RNA polymerase subunit RPC12/RpoP
MKNLKKRSEMKNDAKCPACGHKFKYLNEPESGMGYVACTKCKEPVTQKNIIK